MLNQSRKIMTGQPEDRLWAVVDAVRFASRDNPVTEIRFRSCRGGELMESSLSLEEIEEDTNLPVIVGGTNASGKTSLLRGIREICDLLQNQIITLTDSKKCRSKLKQMGIRHLELDFVVELGTSRSNKFSMGVWGYHSAKTANLVSLTADTYNEHDKSLITSLWGARDVDTHPLFLENVLSIRFEAEEDNQGMIWRDGLRLRRAGRPEAVTKMYQRFGPLHETKQRPLQCRTIKGDEAIKSFLEECEGEDIGGLMLTRFDLWLKQNERQKPIQFQPATLIEVNREGTSEKIEHLRKLVPSLTKKFRAWRENPAILREALYEMMQENRLFTALGLKSSDIFYQERNAPDWLMLHDYAPDIVESMMLKPEWIQHYTWYGQFAWATNKKQQGIDVVMEGCLHDIVNFVARPDRPQRMLIGKPTGAHNRYGETYEVEWVDFDEEQHRQYDRNSEWYCWPRKGSPHGYHNAMLNGQPPRRDAPKLSEVLYELPFLAQLMGMKKEDHALLEVLVRFNAFTPIEKIDHPYLSSGQRQVLALITAVKDAKEGSLILMDEPEISLHVDWQERLVEQLHAPLTGSRLIIATHSPDIVVQHRHLCTVIESSEEGTFYRGE